MKKTIELILTKIPNSDKFLGTVNSQQETPINNINGKYNHSYPFYFIQEGTKEQLSYMLYEFIKLFITIFGDNYESWKDVTIDDVEFKIIEK